MHSANSITARIKRTALFIFAIFIYTFASAQENSPYSRYAIGDLVPSQNIVSRGMGGISAGYIDSAGNYPAFSVPGTVSSTSINLANPASLGSINTTLFDVGGEIDMRTLRSNISPDKYTATNTIISYLQFAFPVSTKRMLAKREYWNVSFGLRPVTRVNYKIVADKRLPGIDSISTLYEGTGGLSQANISTGIKIKNFSFGVSSGYSFGNKSTSTRIGFNTDTAYTVYSQSNTATQSRFDGFFLNLGVQYAIRMRDSSVLRFGATANLQQNLKAKRSNINETIHYNGTTTTDTPIDTVSLIKDQKGRLKLPASYSAGFTYQGQHWLFGVDADYTAWSQYRFYGTSEDVQNSFTIHAGGQYYAAKDNTPIKQYWKFVKYRAGAYYGNDYVNLNSNRPDYGVTLGAGFPSFQSLKTRQFLIVNTGIEIGQHGSRNNLSLRENIFRINLGVSLSAAWFQKRKYD